MIADIQTVVWKERKSLLREQGSRKRAVLTLFVPGLVMAVVLPLQAGEGYTGSPLALFATFLIPLVLVGSTVPESFAGERERHTLTTLLASRLPDRAILLGKMSVSVAYGWGTTLVVLTVALLVANAAHWSGGVRLYSAGIAVALVAYSLLMSILVAGLGVLISLRSSTVRGAQQALISLFLVPLVVVQVVPVVLLSVKREWAEAIFAFLFESGPESAVPGLVVGAVLVALDGLVLWLAMSRFDRGRLISG